MTAEELVVVKECLMMLVRTGGDACVNVGHISLSRHSDPGIVDHDVVLVAV
jgi:hypothetical protein